MKKIVIATTSSLSMLAALVIVFMFSSPNKKHLKASTMSGKIIEQASPTEAIILEAHEMPASQIKETLIDELKAQAISTRNEKFYIEHHRCSPKLLACLLMATKDHAYARHLLEKQQTIALDKLQALRDHEATKEAMKQLELLEGRKMQAVASEVAAIVEKLDVAPAESDVDERVREVSRKLKHIVIVPDGDRRWAKEKGLPAVEGHKRAIISIPLLFEELWRIGIHTTTLSLFSTETWKRSESEISWLMEIFKELLLKMLPLAEQYQVRMVHLGRKDRLPTDLLNTINKIEQKTASFSKHIFNFGIDYGAKDEIIRAYKKLIIQGIKEEDITETLLSSALDTGSQPYPDADFVIRTGKETRTSGLMSWQIGYSELYFPQVYFPDFNVETLKKSLLEFDSRKRRLGK